MSNNKKHFWQLIFVGVCGLENVTGVGQYSFCEL